MRVRLPLLPPSCALGRSAEAPAFQAGEAGSIPAGHSRGSASGRPSGFEPGDGGSTPPPRTRLKPCVSQGKADAGSSNGRMRRSERRHVGSSPAPAAWEAIRTAEEPAWKAGGGIWPLVGSSPTASASWGHGPTGRRRSCKPEIRVRFPVSPLHFTARSRGPAAKTPGSRPGNDGSSPSGINDRSRTRPRYANG